MECWMVVSRHLPAGRYSLTRMGTAFRTPASGALKLIWKVSTRLRMLPRERTRFASWRRQAGHRQVRARPDILSPSLAAHRLVTRILATLLPRCDLAISVLASRKARAD